MTQNLQNLRDEISIFYGPPLIAIADCIRSMIMAAPGNKLVASDFASIEARFLAWLAGEETILEVFRTHGKIYEYTASQIYSVPIPQITKAQRQIGKVAVLALGFGGGVGAFQSMAKTYLVKIADELADDIKIKWRDANPNIVAYWYKLEDAATAALKNKGEKFHVGAKGRHITYMCKGSFLMCQLPSKRVIFYPFAELRLVKTPWGEMRAALTYRGEKNGQWIRIAGYGGLLAENITQAVARDLLREGMFRVEDAGYPIVLHVHDEIVAEVPINRDDLNPDHMSKIMCVLPPWAEGLPIAADGWQGERYRK